MRAQKDNATVNLVSIDQLTADNSKLSRAWKSRWISFDTRMCLGTHEYSLQRQPPSLKCANLCCSLLLLVTSLFHTQRVCFEFYSGVVICEWAQLCEVQGRGGSFSRFADAPIPEQPRRRNDKHCDVFFAPQSANWPTNICTQTGSFSSPFYSSYRSTSTRLVTVSPSSHKEIFVSHIPLCFSFKNQAKKKNWRDKFKAIIIHFQQ